MEVTGDDVYDDNYLSNTLEAIRCKNIKLHLKK